MKPSSLSLLLALGLSPNSVESAPRQDREEVSVTQEGQEAEASTIDTEAQALAHAENMQKKAGGILSELIAMGGISPAQAQSLDNAAKAGDEAKTEAILAEVSGDTTHHEGYNTKTLLISAIALLWFANMIRHCLRGGQISFVQHHLAYIVGLAAMATQVPDHVVHGLVESAIAFIAILGISRVSRGITNKVDFESLSEEEAKTVLTVFGPLASIITTPAASTVFAPLRERLKTEKDKYIAMHGISNVDGAAFIGDFPFLYVWLQKGVLTGTLWQAGVMLPMMAFHKIMQMLYLRVGPEQVLKSREVLWNILKGFRFDPKRLVDAHEIHSEEEQILDGLLEHIRDEIKRLKRSLSKEVVDEVEHLLESEQEGLRSIARGSAEQEEENSPAQLARLEELERELTSELADPQFLGQHVGEAVNALRSALADGRISLDELRKFKEMGRMTEVVQKVPGLQGFLREMERKADRVYLAICNKLKFSHNELEIGRVFTAQALAIGLLVPAVTVLLEGAPALTEPIASVTSAVADNYAATAITWAADNAKALAFSILSGALTIYGNMANLNFLDKDADLKKSMQYARYMVPTLVFAYGMTNGMGAGPSALLGAGTMAAGEGIGALRERFGKRASI